jgi:hypothetical protein
MSFQVSILQGSGFQIQVGDPDGVDEIDWNTFKVSVAGNDTTAYFISMLLRLGGPQLASPYLRLERSETTILINIVPDPEKLMDEHDMFGIPFNGNWLIELEVCDQGGLCAHSSNTVYFGPFVLLGDVIHLACADPSPSLSRLNISPLTGGNTGLDTGDETDFYLILRSNDHPDEYWSYVSSPRLGWRSGIHPSGMHGPSTGAIYVQEPFQCGMIDVNDAQGRTIEVNGSYQLIAGFVDQVSGAIQYDIKDVTMCGTSR